ncbi:MAG: molybdopterin molybdotransferase MoeA, partial [Verrucomicrobiales bacterium]|nr:molybdopterin molybdotransferase MoeA [Verrucomicrobiales bacterium]
MIEESEARKKILELTAVGELEHCALAEALGRHAAVDVVAQVDLPSFDNSAMDGYALRYQDACEVGARLVVTGEQAAGADRALRVDEGEALRIFTGAPMPAGADAVIMQEDVRVIELEGGVRQIEVGDAVDEVGEFVRRRGADVCVGQKIISAGENITPGRIGLLASQGVAELAVHALPRVAVVTTGDELIEPGTEMTAGHIFNSNGPMLAALVKSVLGCEAQRFHARDEAEVLKATLQQALDENDVVLIAGGVSVGDHDLVKPMLNELGVEMDFWRVRIKPGKPFLFGRRGDTQVFGLPGNPVAAYTTFLLFVAAALRKRAGYVGELVESLP